MHDTDVCPILKEFGTFGFSKSMYPSTNISYLPLMASTTLNLLPIKRFNKVLLPDPVAPKTATISF